MLNDTRKKMLERVRAIMSKTMANGCTEGEAMAALEKAQELMAAYDISEADIGAAAQGEQEGATIWRDDPNDPYQIKRYLAVGVGKFTRCRSWRGTRNEVTFCGLESDVLFAQWLLETLQRFVKRELTAHQRARKAAGLSCPRIVSSSFVLGCSKRIYARLLELSPKDPVSTNGNALTVSRNALIDACMDAAGIKLRDVRSRSRHVDRGAFNAGTSAGDSARFDRPVSAGGALLLG